MLMRAAEGREWCFQK